MFDFEYDVNKFITWIGYFKIFDLIFKKLKVFSKQFITQFVCKGSLLGCKVHDGKTEITGAGDELIVSPIEALDATQMYFFPKKELFGLKVENEEIAILRPNRTPGAIFL
jgi:hypothetical protein